VSSNNTPEALTPSNKASVLRNWISLYGLVVVVGSIFSFLLLFTLDFFAPNANPYVGILAYLIVPCFFAAGVGITAIGWAWQRWRLRHHLASGRVVDFSLPTDRRNLFIFFAVAGLFLFLTAMASYHSYHYTESVNFCGQACHTAMGPEFTAYQHSPHARVACAECHVGSGVSSYVKAKVSGLHQVYAIATDSFARPIKTHNSMRPAQETCEQCHWPERYVGNLERTYTRYLSDPDNPPYSVRLLLKVGGAEPSRGPVGGIHWHMNVANKIEYISTDESNQTIPWVRMTSPQGVVTVFKDAKFTGNPAKLQIQRMDCMDCHNRPAHTFKSPNDALDLALSTGALDVTMPSIKKVSAEILSASYKTNEEALQKIATTLSAKYVSHPRLQATIEEVQKIYQLNFFPELKADWRSYPNNIGHKDWPGCFRCHDGQHVTEDKKQTIKANDCNACHHILAQGKGTQLEDLKITGQAFEHPGGDYGDSKCTECHTGTSQ
jgi:nitrate/TMAO reductase-like tetraheme cytochrome c subunit